ncbi:MAG: hypothetical protein ACI90V_014483, partial [Bacillariaceae sp.]
FLFIEATHYIDAWYETYLLVGPNTYVLIHKNVRRHIFFVFEREISTENTRWQVCNSKL